jgi:hypothetical protein
MYYNKPDLPFHVFIFKPPVKLSGYFAPSPIKDSRLQVAGTVYVTHHTPAEFRQIYQDGSPTSQMKQWLLYS